MPVPYYVLLGGSRNGERVVSDRTVDELRLPLRDRTAMHWLRPEITERYRVTGEIREGFRVAGLVVGASSTAVAGYLSTG